MERRLSRWRLGRRVVDGLVGLGLRVFALGVGAGALAVALSFILRLFAGGSFLPEIASQAFFSVVPGRLESGAVESLGSLAKYTTYTVAVAVNLVLYGLIAVLVFNIKGVNRGSLLPKGLAIAGLAYAITLLLSGLFLSITQVNSQPISPTTLALELLPPILLFGFSLTSLEARYAPTGLDRELVPEDFRPFDARRRSIIIAGGAIAAFAVIALYGLGFLQPGRARSGDLSSFFGSEVTSNGNFYRVDINVFTPSVQASSWSLKIGGMVNTPLTLGYDQMKALPAIEQYNTLACVSNVIGGDLMSTSKWKGVKLKDVLATAGVQSQATYVIFKCSDQYDVGIPLAKAMEDATILAYEMNGVPLSQDHGYPLRAIVPGYYGMMNPKWIAEIQLADQTYQGFWQRSGWANEAQYQTGSTIVNIGNDALADRFDVTSPSSLMHGAPTTIVGVAFAGERGISKVEVSTDKANTWAPATLTAPLSGNSWVLWSFDWTPTAAGTYNVIVRATDGEGNLQPEGVADPFPSGATGWHYVTVQVT
jgi:DMSO/TMAO reductase YedYZ molybdopterin-dependent catalytic subunit